MRGDKSMRVWLELNQQEGERLFAEVKEFAVDRMQTAVVSTKKKEPDESADQEEPEKPISIEQIRAVLAEKSQSGKQPEVKALITKYGAKKLTDIDPASYRELHKEAEVL